MITVENLRILLYSLYSNSLITNINITNLWNFNITEKTYNKISNKILRYNWIKILDQNIQKSQIVKLSKIQNFHWTVIVVRFFIIYIISMKL